MFFQPLIPVFYLAALFTKGPQFTAETVDDQVSMAHSLAIGDVDGDGRPDILLADRSQLVWYRNGDWKRFVLADGFTGYDPVTIAARDIDGDGKVEIAVGTRGNRGETSETSVSGTVHYFIRPEDPTQLWTHVTLYDGLAVHRMQWVNVGDGNHQLVTLPQHGTGREDDQAQNLLAFEKPEDPIMPWKHRTILQPMQMTHHLHVYDYSDSEIVYVSGESGVMGFAFKNGRWTRNTDDWLARGRQLSEVHVGRVASRNAHVFAAIEPYHGNMVTVYTPGLTDSLLVYDKIKRVILERKMEGGHGLGMADFLGLGRDQVVAGSRKPNEDGHFGIKLYVPYNPYWEAVDVYWVDRDGIACEDLQIADLDGDGKLDIIAFGRLTNNLKIYWNRTE